MRYITPEYMSLLPEGGDTPAWSLTVGDRSEKGLNLSDAGAAALMLLEFDGLRYKTRRDPAPAEPVEGVSEEQLSLLSDALASLDLILQDRQLAMRTDLLLALTYGYEFETMFPGEDRISYEELDWGYTEQPWRQLSLITPLEGRWDIKLDNLLEILQDIRALCGDEVLNARIDRTLEELGGSTPDAFKNLRERFDEAMKETEYRFSNLMQAMIHRHWYDNVQKLTIVPCLQQAMTEFAVIRAISAVIWQEAGELPDEVFNTLCCHYAAAIDENTAVQSVLLKHMAEKPIYQKEMLERTLWQ